jgi:hypothetical protein
VILDVPSRLTEGVAGSDDSVVEPGLPFELGHPILPDAFGAHRFVLAHDGAQRMGV